MPVLVVVGTGAADHDLILLDGYLDRPVAGPVLRVDRAVRDGRVEPEPVPLLAVVERALEGGRGGSATCATPPSATTAATLGGVIVGIAIGFGVLVLVGVL